MDKHLTTNQEISVNHNKDSLTAVVPPFSREVTEMAYHLIRVVGIIFTLTLLLAILLRPAHAGEVVTASISSNEQLDESALTYLVIVIGAVLLAVWVWAEKMWGFIPS